MHVQEHKFAHGSKTQANLRGIDKRKHSQHSKSITELLHELKYADAQEAKNRLSQTRIVQSRKEGLQINESMEVLNKQIDLI